MSVLKCQNHVKLMQFVATVMGVMNALAAVATLEMESCAQVLAYWTTSVLPWIYQCHLSLDHLPYWMSLFPTKKAGWHFILFSCEWKLSRPDIQNLLPPVLILITVSIIVGQHTFKWLQSMYGAGFHTEGERPGIPDYRLIQRFFSLKTIHIIN